MDKEGIKDIARWLLRMQGPRALLASGLWRPRGVRVPGLVLSLTTHGDRLGTVDAALLSILRGDVLPQSIVLCLNEPIPCGPSGRHLRRLQALGVEVLLVENLGPHTKYFHVVQHLLAPGQVLVTADDDIYYPPQWLAELVQAHRSHPRDVICHWGKRVIPAQCGLRSYHDWDYINTTEPSILHFALGVGGVLYPASMLAALKAAGKGFVQQCPRADDIWLHAVAVRSGHRIRQVRPSFRWPVHLPGTQASGLLHSNHRPDGNDRQIAATYDEDLLQRLMAAYVAERV